MKQEFDSQFLNDDQMEAEEKVKKILERRIEELNATRHLLHAKVVAYSSSEEMKAMASEYN